MNTGTSGGPTPRRARVSPFLPALSALMALALLPGCGGGSSSTTTPIVDPVIPPPTLPSVSAPALGRFTVTLSENTAAISTGGAVNYTLTVANTSSSPATLVTNTSNGVNIPVASLFITNAAGQTVYPPIAQPGAKPQDSPPPPPSGGPVTLQPGQSVSVTRPLSVFKTAGTYQAVATFSVAATGADTPQSVTLSPLAVTAR